MNLAAKYVQHNREVDLVKMGRPLPLSPPFTVTGLGYAGALSRLDVISAPAFGRMTVIEALKAGLRSAQVKIEGGQKSTFGAGGMGRPDKAMVVAGMCPIHGPVVQSATTELIYKYRHAFFFDWEEMSFWLGSVQLI